MYALKIITRENKFVLRYKNTTVKIQARAKRGLSGEQGEAATVQVGTVTTVNPNDPATVTNVGTDTEAIFDFGIPKGEKGDKGDSGGVIDSVNGQIGTVVLDADDIDDTSTTHKFATASQLSNADSAVQPADLATVATTGDYDDLTDKPTIPAQFNPIGGTNIGLSGTYPDITFNANDPSWGDITGTLSNQTDLQNVLDAKVDETITVNGNALSSNVTLDIDDVAPTQTGNNGKVLQTDGTNATWQTVSGGGGGAVDSVNGATGAVVLDPDDLDDASTSHKFVTSSDLTNLGNLSGTNTGDQDLSSLQPKPSEGAFANGDKTKLDGIEALADVTDAGNVGSSIHGASGKTTPVDADTVPLIDSAASNVLKKVSWSNIKATLKTYFDTLYAAISHTHTASQVTDFDTEVSNNTDVAANTSARHTRSHTMTSTSDHTSGNHKTFYSNGSGQVVELTHGDSGKVLTSNGATSAPTWETVSGGGGGTMDDFLVDADTGDAETVGDGNTLTIAGGTGIDTAVSATDTVTINLDSATQSSLGKADTALQNITGEDLGDLSNVTESSVGNDEVLQYVTDHWENQTLSEAGIAAASHTHTASQVTDFDTEVGNNTDVAANTAARHSHSNKSTLDSITAAYTTEEASKLSGIEALADVTDTANVTSAGALMDSEVTNLSAVKAFDPTDYATNTQGGLADTALQPGDDISELNNDSGFTSNAGTVTSVAVSGSDGIEVDSGSPVTTSGTIALGVNKSSLLSHINVEDGADVTDAANVSTSGGMITVNHGATSGTARPSVSGAVLWVGSVEPTNASNGDVWVDTA